MKRFNSNGQRNVTEENNGLIMISWANSDEQCFPEDMLIEKNIRDARKNAYFFSSYRV